MPPRMPSRALVVFFAISWPPGTLTVTSRPCCASSRGAASRRLSAMFWRGTGLIAGPPTASPRPGSVTVPTPSPATNVISPAWPGSRRRSTVR